ncbi:flagellar hook-length control protein FliK [Saccharospirillum mangrovi]|uniref:flagellar hook-length control protein FliK n=1 Tax=Saccharospirillum mangrovi TaxID=2161747 RepID=UPI000D393FCC|nr:flagellar hook-length control protein FliK [Saccharospirillum mangrovi]
MLFLTSPDASLTPAKATQGVTPGVLKTNAGAASGGEFARLLSGANTPRTLSGEADAPAELTPQMLNAALGKAGVAVEGEGQNLPLQRQAMVGALPLTGVDTKLPLDGAVAANGGLTGLDLVVDGDDGLKTSNLPATSWLARLFGLGPTQDEAADALDGLDSSLNQVTATIAQLLGVKPLSEAVDYDPDSDGDFNVEAALAELGIDLPADAIEQWVSADTLVVDPEAVDQLTDYLHHELGLNLVETDTVIQALTNWVQNPPHIDLTPEQLAAADSSQWQQVEQLTQLLDELDVQFSSWLDQMNAAANGESGDAVAQTPALSDGLRTLADALSGKNALDSDGKVPSPAVMISRLLQSVQNSATNGSLPITMDQSRPEQALLLTPASQPSSDVVFSTTLMRMARETLGGKSEADSRLAALNSATTASADSTSVSSLSLSQTDSPDQTALLDLKRVDRPMISADVSQRLSERIQMMAQGDIKHATIRLDPPELGALEIKVTVHNDQTQVQIVSPHPQVREALEAQSVRLREFLEQQGLNLSNLDVRDQSANGNASSGDGQGEGGGTGGDAESDAEAPVAATAARPLGLVDQFV